MPDTTLQEDTIERYARLCALLDDPFADRVAILAAAELDEHTWGEIGTRWNEQLRAGEDRTLGQRFAQTYGATMSEIANGAPPKAESGTASSAAQGTARLDEADTLDDTPTDAVDATLPVPEHVSPRPATPFVPRPVRVVSRDPADQTLDIPESISTRPAVPFTRR